jgi:hypothetical protein
MRGYPMYLKSMIYLFLSILSLERLVRTVFIMIEVVSHCWLFRFMVGAIKARG